jgi:hypothetical protein
MDGILRGPRLRLLLAAGGLCALVACRTTPPATGPGTTPGTAVPGASPAAPTPPASAPPSSPPQRPAAPAEGPLAAESRWLAELFAGTPVSVVNERDGSVLLKVPMTYAFDAAPAPATTPKRPLQAVLDKLSQCLKRQPAARLQASAPGPAAAERVAAMRGVLAKGGVGDWRVVTVAAASPDAVHLRLLPAPGGMRRLDDANLPPTGAGQVVPAR